MHELLYVTSSVTVTDRHLLMLRVLLCSAVNVRYTGGKCQENKMHECKFSGQDNLVLGWWASLQFLSPDLVSSSAMSCHFHSPKKDSNSLFFR
jgi:hypothetical protein